MVAEFEPDEYFKLALHASSVRDHRACIEYLKLLLTRQPHHARALYLLAMQHAELGLVDRAIAGLQFALRLEPGLETARLQLAVVLLDQRRADEAREHLAALAGSQDSALRLCVDALTSIAADDLESARGKLRLSTGMSKPGATWGAYSP
jgi:tetratricopeptide (TPR) repeat protein